MREIEIYQKTRLNAINSEWLEHDEIRRIDNKINIENINSAIYYSESGIIDPNSLIRYLYNESIKNDVQILRNRRVQNID